MKARLALLLFGMFSCFSVRHAARADDLQPSDGAPRGGACDACDVNCDSIRNVTDVAAFADVLVDLASPCSDCAGDIDLNNTIDGADVQPFVECLLFVQPLGTCCVDGGSCIVATQSECAGLWLGAFTPCEASTCTIGKLTAYRPQHGGGYFPFTKTAVPDAIEENIVSGSGIRINAPGDVDSNGEDDLIEVFIETTQPGIALALHRTNSALHVWTTRTKTALTEITFTNDETAALPFAPGAGSLTVWVEWAETVHGDGELRLKPVEANLTLDALRFHTFTGIVTALGGEDQVPSVPVDINHGTFVVGIALYQQGYDVYMFDEDRVAADGSGLVYNEVVTAVRDRAVNQVAIFGYSHGGGSTHDLAERLDNDRAGIGIFEIVATSYADGVQNDSDIDFDQELRRPPSTAYHANHYQVGTLSDFFLDGGPVPNSNPAPTGLNVETTPWGAGSTHFTVDDYVQVRSYIETNIATRLAP